MTIMTIITNTPTPSKPPNRAFFDEEPSKQKKLLYIQK